MANLSSILAGNVPLTSNTGLLEALAEKRHTRLLTLVLAPHIPFTAEVVPPLLEVLDELEGGGGLDLFLGHLGSATPETWRIVSILRERFDRFTAIVPFAATPGATQVALGADALMMGEASSLAPLEPPRVKGVNLATGTGDRLSLSAYDVHHYISFMKRQLGGALDPNSEVLKHLWEHIDPLVVGATERAHQANRQVARRCLETHLDAEEDAERVDAILDELASGRFGHRFPITRRDCERRLGLSVIKPPKDLWADVWALHEYYQGVLELEADLNLEDHQHYTFGFDGFIDTGKTRRVLVRVNRVDDKGRTLADRPTLHRWVEPQTRDVVLDEELEL